MPATKNPFEILGLNPYIVRDLTDEQIQTLLKRQYRLLQLFFHPDKPSGNEARSKEINRAFDLLDYQKHPEEYKLQKEKFLRTTPLRQKLSELEEELASKTAMYSAKEEKSHEQLLSYLGSISGLEPGQNVFNFYPARLKMYDEGLRTKAPTNWTAKKSEYAYLFYEMIVREDGTVVKKRSGREEHYSNKRLIGTIPDSVFKQEDARAPRKPIGMAIDFWTPEDDGNASGRLAGARGELLPYLNQAKNDYERISMDSFKKIEHLLSPSIALHSHLFSINKEQEAIFFSLEGMVLKVEMLKS